MVETGTPQQRLRELIGPRLSAGPWSLCLNRACLVPAVVEGDPPRMPVNRSVRGLAWASQPILLCGACEGELFRVVLSGQDLEVSGAAV
jgi:hypothetical protein